MHRAGKCLFVERVGGIVMVAALCVAGGGSAGELSNPAVLGGRANITAHTFIGSLTQELGCRYLLYVPEEYARQPETAWPLIVYLHGRSPDRDPQPNELAGHFQELLTRMSLPAFFVTPLCPGGNGWRAELVAALLDELRSLYRIDPDRVSLCGMSMGGYGTWSTVMAYPDRFASAVSLCGGGNPGAAARMKDVPIWNIHGAKDDIVPLEESERPVKALREAGGYVIHTVEPEADHMKLIPWSLDPRIYDWMLAQRRGVRPDPADIPTREAMRMADAPARPAARTACPPILLREFARPFTDTYETGALVYLPPGYAAQPKAWPLVVFLHGSGEKGTDLSLLPKYGPMKVLAAGQDLPMIVAAPQCPDDTWDWQPEHVVTVVDEVCRRWSVDPDRVYLMGLSMGARGVWRTLSLCPDRFAAGVALAGCDLPIDPYAMRRVPTWTVFAEKDEAFDIDWCKRILNTARQAGCDVRCTIIPGARHMDMTHWSEDPAAFDWLLARRRGCVTPREAAAGNEW